MINFHQLCTNQSNLFSSKYLPFHVSRNPIISPLIPFPLLPFLKIFIFFFNLFLLVLGLRCCTWTFSSCGKEGLLSSCDSWASHCVGFSICSMWA